MEIPEEFFERRMIVYPSCTRQELDTGMITVMDICEGFQGEDIVSYQCPICGGTHQSAVFAK